MFRARGKKVRDEDDLENRGSPFCGLKGDMSGPPLIAGMRKEGQLV